MALMMVDMTVGTMVQEAETSAPEPVDVKVAELAVLMAGLKSQNLLLMDILFRAPSIALMNNALESHW